MEVMGMAGGEGAGGGLGSRPPAPTRRSGAWEPLAGRAWERAAWTVAVCLCAESQVLFNRPPVWYLEEECFETSARSQLEP